jgi:hypothetical protein
MIWSTDGNSALNFRTSLFQIQLDLEHGGFVQAYTKASTKPVKNGGFYQGDIARAKSLT